MSGRRTFVVALVALGLALPAGCQRSSRFVWVSDLPATGSPDLPRIRPGDRLYLLVRGQETLTGEIPVREDGSIVHPIFGRVAVADLSTAEAARAVENRLQNVVTAPDVSLSIAATSPCKVSVVGEVMHPGLLEIDPRENMLHVLARAGGFTEFANRNGIYVIRERPSNERVRFRFDDLEGGDAKSLSFRLHDGDVVVVE
jgi:polysaccharide export outer membrane protein